MAGDLKNRILEARQFTALKDGITVRQAVTTPGLPFAEITLKTWCLKPCPLLGRILRHECRGSCDRFGRAHQDTLFISRSDLDEIVKAADNLLNHPVADNGGQWIAEGIYQDSQGLWYTSGYLKKKVFADVVSPNTWFAWVKNPCPHLDPKANGGKIHTQKVTGPTSRSNRLWGAVDNVFWQNDVKQILERRTSHKARVTPPGKNGEWLTADIYQDADGLWFTPEKAVARYCISDAAIRYWRRHPHPSLDPKVNEGKVRSQRLPRPNKQRGPIWTPVMSQKDLDKIERHRRGEQARAAEFQPQEGGESAEQLADRFGLIEPWDVLALKPVLYRFSQECPAGAWREPHWNDRLNRLFNVWRYDPEKFQGWLGDRTIQEVASGLTRDCSQKAEAKRDRAIAFLEEALAGGAEVAAGEIRKRAKEASISDSALRAARIARGVERIPGTNRRVRLWRLPRIRAAGSATSHSVRPEKDAAEGEYPGHARKPYRTGAKPDPDTERRNQFCYDEYIVNNRSRRQVLDAVRRKFPDNAPKEGPEAGAAIPTYAKRWANCFEPPLPLDPEEAQKFRAGRG
jgi:hypothetical protein